MLCAGQIRSLPITLCPVYPDAPYADLRTPRPVPVKMTRSFLITANAIRNRRNSMKTHDGDDF
jgi:hypothetical protein